MKNNSILETTGQDWANHLSHEISGNGRLFLIALLPGGLDMEALRQAAADLTQLQPVLGCRFDDSQDPPRWVPQEDAVQVAEMAADHLREGLRQGLPCPVEPMLQCQAGRPSNENGSSSRPVGKTGV